MKTNVILQITPGQLKQFAFDVIEAYRATNNGEPNGNDTSGNDTSGKRYVYGIRGIRELFNVSHVTAQRYKDTFLKPAVMQRGRKIIVDADMALGLYADAMNTNK